MCRGDDGTVHTVALPDTREVFTALVPPIGPFDRVVADVEALETALADVDPRWRPDLVLAVDDLVGAG